MTNHISIHAPRAGGDEDVLQRAIISYAFQSTPPVRGATAYFYKGGIGFWNFNPRPPCGGRHRGLVNASDFKTFQSTPPVRGATV